MELEDAVEHARNTIEFLLGCLTRPEKYQHAYPEQTINSLERLNQVYPPQEGCPHSLYTDDCISCINKYIRKAEKRKLENKIKHPNWMIGHVEFVSDGTFWCLLKQDGKEDKELEGDVSALEEKQRQYCIVGRIVRYSEVNDELEFMVDTDEWI